MRFPIIYRKILLTVVTSMVTGFLFLTDCNKPGKHEAYLFTYFTGNNPGEEAIRFSVSLDGYNYRALNNNEPVLDSKIISKSGGVRDPHILRGDDGKLFTWLPQTR
jgi:arabinoxylan arabinofuranohydrolase